VRDADISVIVIAKEPVPGRVKTRLCPPCTPAQAARLAEAALRDTLAAAGAASVGRRVLALDGRPGDWMPAGWDVIGQRGDGLDERLAAAFADVGGPALLVGMDTPQLTGEALRAATGALLEPGCDAVLGPTLDGGYWTVGLRAPRADAFVGVPMSRADTCDRQHARLLGLGLRVTTLGVLRDIDTFADARAVAERHPSGAFAVAMDDLRRATAASAA